MFKRTNKMLELDELSNFIENPSQNCTDEELIRGINIVLVVLDKNPYDLMKVISNSLIPATYLFSDLVEKMKKTHCAEKLWPLFIKCFDELVDQCIYNVYDLKRFLEAATNYLDKVMETILLSELHMQRLFGNNENSTETLEEIGKNYQLYNERFSSFRC